MTNSALIQDFFNRMVGWEHLLSQVASSNNRSNFPPFNIVKDGDSTEIQLALAGYSKDDVSVSVQDKVLTISSSGVDKHDDIEDNYRGVAKRAFTTKFSLGQYNEVKDVSMRDGMLCVSTQEILPEEKKLKTFTIN